MHFTLTDEQDALRDAAASLLDKASSIERVRAAEPGGFDEGVWQGLVDLGVIEAGAGGEATLVDLSLVAEECGAHLAPAPFVEAAVAARLLGWTDARLTTFAPRPAVDGVATLVPGGAVAGAVVALHGDQLVLATIMDANRHLHPGNLASAPVADVELAGAEVVASGAEAITRFERAVDEWRLLTAAALAGLGRSALALGVAYVKERNQFGVPIGSFQAIQHDLANRSTELDGAALLVREAAWAAVDGTSDAGTLAAMAYAYSGEKAEAAAQSALHFHGGYGYMLEYDAQLYLRRAKAWQVALGDPRRQLQVVADRAWPAGGDGTTVLERRLDEANETFQREIRTFISEHLTNEVLETARSTGTYHDWDFHRAFCAKGYLAAGWPTEVGGLGRSPVETNTLMQEMFLAGAPMDGAATTALVAATLLIKGTEEQRTQILPRILNGEVMSCLGYSEPEAGSDVAAAQTRAVRDGEEWVINGQKMFTSFGHIAQYVFLLTRTDPDKAKHRGLTMFLVPMDTPGISISPVHTVGGVRTNITFYDDVRVPDSCRVGDVDDGWSVMQAALVYERNATNWGEPAALVDDVARWAHGSGLLADPLVRDRLARHATALEAGRLLSYRASWLAAEGGMPMVEGSMAKLLLSDTFLAASRDLFDLVGEAAVLGHDDEDAPIGGLVEHAYRHAVVTTIYGGTSEVQRGIIAQRGLGLPRPS